MFSCPSSRRTAFFGRFPGIGYLASKPALPAIDPYKVLGLSPGASEKQVKSAYRRLALKYHPDRNTDPGAKQKFQEVTAAYRFITEHPEPAGDEAPSYQDRVASEVLRRERERMRKQANARRDRKKREEDYFKRPEWHDPLLILRYMLHAFALLFAAASLVVPVLIAILVDPASLAGTFFFLVAGGFLSVYIYQKRDTWFRLGKLNMGWKDVVLFMRMNPVQQSTDRCCYCKNIQADGKSYRIELLKTVDIKITSFGVLNHAASYKNKIKRVVIPRSARAHYYHKLSSMIKIVSILTCLLVFPVESILWRFLAGLVTGGLFSALLLAVFRVRSRVSYLLTPALLLKGLIWIFALYQISEFGPGLNIQTSGHVYIVVAGLLFFLDMLFDLLLGFLPFYRKLFHPMVRQGKMLESLYREGYQNNLELPVYSVLFPLFRWLF